MQLETLVEKFKQKDSAAFEKLYNMYAENICGVINTIVKNDSRANELCNDVFVKVWEKSHMYNSSKGRFFTWILNIARNTAIDELRSKSYKKDKKNLSVDYFVGILHETENLDSKVDAIGIKKYLKGLKDVCIQLIEMLYFGGYTQKEASEELNIPIGTVKTRNRSCISKLRKNILR